MSARMLAVLRCDHEGCEQGLRTALRVERRAVAWKPPRLGDARALARAEGWRHGVRLRADSGPAPSFDFCPEHAADIEGYREVVGPVCHLSREVTP